MTRTIGIRIICVAAAVILALASIFGVAKLTTDPAFYQKSIAALEEKQETVLELTAALARCHGNPRRDMFHAYRRVRRVHALSARTCRAKHLHLAIARQLLDRHLGIARILAPSHLVLIHINTSPHKKCDKGKIPLSHRIPIACVARLGEGDLAGIAVHIGDAG